METCALKHCAERAKCKGFCDKHYQEFKRWVRNRDQPKRAKAKDGAPFRVLLETLVSPPQERCVPWPFGRSSRGYGGVTILGLKFIPSRLMCEIVHGPAPTPEHQTAHNCGRGDIGCIHPEHVRWATPAENQADRLIHGTHNRGEQHGNAHLSEDKVHTIRRLKGTMPYTEIAALVGVSTSQVCRVIKKQSWSWLPEQSGDASEGASA